MKSHGPLGSKSSLEHRSDGAWKFDANVAEVFDDMIARSIPDYRGMRKAVESLMIYTLRDGDVVLDLGCSTGAMFRGLVSARAATGSGPDTLSYDGIDSSEEMVAICRDRHPDGCVDQGVIPTWVWGDIADPAAWRPTIEGYGVVLSLLTLQFAPVPIRKSIVRRVFEALRPGGMFLMVEKVVGSTAEVTKVFEELYFNHKSEQGYSHAAINNKRKALEGVLVPMTAGQNQQILEDAGFNIVECFWRRLNFAGWAAIKEA